MASVEKERFSMPDVTSGVILKTSLMVLVLTLVGKTLAIASNIIFASTYGTGHQMDAFFLALMLPQILYSWTSGPRARKAHGRWRMP